MFSRDSIFPTRENNPPICKTRRVKQRKMKAQILTTLMVIVGLLAPSGVRAQVSNLDWLSAGATERISDLRYQRLQLSPTTPDGLKKPPPNLEMPVYGTLKIGPREHPTAVLVVLEETEEKEPRLFVDVSGNGDLSKATALPWQTSQYVGYDDQKRTLYQAAFEVPVQYDEGVQKLRIKVIRYDRTDLNHRNDRMSLFYQSDYARTGQVRIGNKSYPALLADFYTQGDFRQPAEKDRIGPMLLIDRNGNGVLGERGEILSLGRPFKIEGVTYEVRSMSASGGQVEVKLSSEDAIEIPPPTDLRVGKKAPPFVWKTRDGNTVHFPEDYKGKLVILYFWASWCPDCQRETPGFVKVTDELRPQGLEVLGISRDLLDSEQKVTQFIQANKMSFHNIYNRRGDHVTLQVLYNDPSTPSVFLVDGDTGLLLAYVPYADIAAGKLRPTLLDALARRKRK